MKSGFVSLIGRRNAGKSTLLNRLVGSKLAIVSDKPQTTRNRILGVRNYPDAQVVYFDTPGIHRPLHRMNVRMVDAAVDSIGEVDVLGVVVDAPERGGKGHEFVMDLARKSNVPAFLILNKIDLMKKSRLLPLIEQYHQSGIFAEIIWGGSLKAFLGALGTPNFLGDDINEYSVDEALEILPKAQVQKKNGMYDAGVHIDGRWDL